MTPRSLSPMCALRTRLTSTAILVVATLAAVAFPAAASTVITWTNPAGGLWSDPGNWNPANVPDSPGEAAVLPALSGGYEVTLDLQPAIDQLDVAAGDPTLDLAGFSLGPIGKVENYGTIKNFTGFYNSASIRNHTGGLIRGAPDGVISAGESIDSDGTIEVGPGEFSKLDAPMGLALIGTGRLHLNRSTIFDPQGDFGGVLVVRSGFTLSGTGLISKRLMNYGTLECTESRPILKIDAILYNYGTTRVSGGGKIQVNRPLVKNGGGTITSGPGGGTFTQLLDSGNQGTLALDGSGRLVVDGGDLTIVCGMLYDGEIQRVGSTGTLNIELANMQNITITSGADVTVTGHADLMVAMQHFVNHGTLHVKGSMHFGILDSPIVYPLEGTGVLKLEGGRLGSGTGGVLLNPAGMTIEGCGTIMPPFVNEGTLNLECGTSVIGAPGLWRNRGTMRVRGGKLTVSGANTVLRNQGRLEVQNRMNVEQGATLDNTGSAISAAGGRVVLGGVHSYRGTIRTSRGTIRGGKLDATGAGEYYVQSSATLEGVELAPAASLVTATGAVAQVTGPSFTNQGTVRILGTGRMELPSSTQYVQPGGLTSIEGGTLVSPATQIRGGVLRGIGTIVGGLENGGTVSPGVGTAGILVQGDYTQLGGGILEASIAGPAVGQSSRLLVSGRATLAGTVVPTLLGSYVPEAGATFDILRYDSFEGRLEGRQGMGPATSTLGLVPLFGEDGMKLVTVVTTGVGDAEPAVAVLRFQGRRTPRGASFVLELPWASQLDGRLYDAAGREVARLVEGARPAGVHSFAVDRGLATGIYFARIGIVADGVREVRTARVAVLR